MSIFARARIRAGTVAKSCLTTHSQPFTRETPNACICIFRGSLLESYNIVAQHNTTIGSLGLGKLHYAAVPSGRRYRTGCKVSHPHHIVQNGHTFVSPYCMSIWLLYNKDKEALSPKTVQEIRRPACWVSTYLQ